MEDDRPRPPSAPPAPGTGGAWLKVVRWLFFAACVALFARTLLAADLAAAWGRIRPLGPVALAVLLPFPFAMAMDAWAWQGLLAAIDRRVGWFTLFQLRIGTEAVTNSAPAGGLWADAISPVLVWQRTGTPMVDVFAAATAKRWTVARMHGAYVALACGFAFDAIARVSRALLGNEALLTLTLLSALGLLLVSIGIETVAARGQVAERLARALGRARFGRVKAWIEARQHHFTHADAQLARISRDRRASVTASWRMLGLWLVEGLETYLILRLLGAPLGLREVLALDAALSVIRTAAIFAPGGIGVQDVSYLAVFEAYGVPDAASLGTAFIVLKRAKEAAWVAVGFAMLARRAPRQLLLHPPGVLETESPEEPPGPA